VIAGQEEFPCWRRCELLAENPLPLLAICLDEAVVIDVVTEEEHAARMDGLRPAAECGERGVVFEIQAGVSDQQHAMLDLEGRHIASGPLGDPRRPVRSVIRPLEPVRIATADRRDQSQQPRHTRPGHSALPPHPPHDAGAAHDVTESKHGGYALPLARS
jgi:hypothetical protein